MTRTSAWHEGHILGGYQNPACNECRREQRGPMTTEEFAAVDPVPRPPVDPRTADIERAIAIVEDSRSTHVHWRDWRRAGHGTDEDHEMVGDLAHHEEAIADYDHVLSVLRRLAVTPSEPDGAQGEGPTYRCDGGCACGCHDTFGQTVRVVREGQA